MMPSLYEELRRRADELAQQRAAEAQWQTADVTGRIGEGFRNLEDAARAHAQRTRADALAPPGRANQPDRRAALPMEDSK